MEYTKHEAEQDEHEERIEVLARHWHKQLVEQGYVTGDRMFFEPRVGINPIIGPFSPDDEIRESDFLQWAESDGAGEHFTRDDIYPCLEYHAREYLGGRWG